VLARDRARLFAEYLVPEKPVAIPAGAHRQLRLLETSKWRRSECSRRRVARRLLTPVTFS